MFEADLPILGRLLIIIVLAGVLGWERESVGKSAGLRTHILVGISSVLFVVLGEYFVTRFETFGDRMRFDPIRIIEAIVTGISFLGAGTIFVSRGKNQVKGLTTAAGILTTSAIGMLVAMERFLLAVGCTVIVFIVLRVVKVFDRPELEDNEGA